MYTQQHEEEGKERDGGFCQEGIIKGLQTLREEGMQLLYIYQPLVVPLST